MTTTPTPRSTADRQANAIQKLSTHTQLWLATSSAVTGPHMIPVSFIWDGTTLTMATFQRSRTADNLRRDPRARVAIGTTDDVLVINGDIVFVEVEGLDDRRADAYAQVSHDPRVMPGMIYLQMTPLRAQVWNGFHEFTGRDVMIDGRWLANTASAQRENEVEQL